MTTNNKKGPLSKAEKEVIATMFIHGDGIEIISDAINRSEKVVVKYLDSVKAPEPLVIDKKTGEPITNSKKGETGKMFARNEKYGATIMTQNASVASDESRATRQESANSANRFAGRIHVIKKDS